MFFSCPSGRTDSETPARIEERLSKTRALQLFDHGLPDSLKAGSFQSLAWIHRHLFSDVWPFAGEIRGVNLAKSGFAFAPVFCLPQALTQIEQMPQSTLEEITAKYIEMNIAHPFRDGNGRSMRIWLNDLLEKELHQIIDWSRICKEDYLQAMERSPVNDQSLRLLFQSALTDPVHERKVRMEGIDASWSYEGFDEYPTKDLDWMRQP